MCGIFGKIDLLHPLNLDQLRLARDSIKHRGPDDFGEYLDNSKKLYFGHRRLSIVDLSPGGHQPMFGPDDQTVIVFNGEIYNHHELRAELMAMGHRFKSTSDTEVILAAYKEWSFECLSHLNGIFAFALHDRIKNLVFFARDRAGEKPLFYKYEKGTLTFASELKAVLQADDSPRKLDRLSADCYLALGYVPQDRSMVEGIKKLPAGNHMNFDLASGELKIEQYWTLPDLNKDANDANFDEILVELEGLLEDSTKRQMMADVPVGVLLSGGVDSSLITAMATRSGQKVKTFTIRFPGFGSYDETEHARLIANHFGTEHTELDASVVSPELFSDLARRFDEPMVDSSIIPTYLVSKLIREHCTVALGGDGGDELFGGYSSYDGTLQLESRLKKIPAPLRRLVASLSSGVLPLGFKGRNYLRSYGYDLGSGNLPLGLFDKSGRKKLIASKNNWNFAAEAIKRGQAVFGVDLVDKMTRADFNHYLSEDILVKVDRASMLNSLEVRAPFLDYRIVNFAFSRIPSKFKATPSQRKIMLKALAQRVLPKEFDLARKQGFSIPLGSMLATPEFNSFFSDLLSSSSSGLFSKSYVSSLVRGQLKGRSNSERLFALVMFETWMKENKISL